MEVGEVIQNGGLVVGGGLIVKIGDWLSSWLRSRNQRTEITPVPLPVDKLDKYVTRGEFNQHVADNARDHENLFGRLNRNDRETSEIKGLLTGMRDDLSAIKQKLFKDR